MSSRLAGILLVGASCVVAAGAGAYLAVRQNGQLPPAAQLADATPVSVSSPAGDAMPDAPSLRLEKAGDVGPSSSRAPDATFASAKPAPVTKASPEPKRQATTPRTTSAAAPDERPAKTPDVQRQVPVAAAEVPQPAVAQSADTNGNGHSEPTPSPVFEPPVLPQPRFDDLLIPSDSVIGLQVENALSSSTARVEDRVNARVTRDVRVGGEVAIPAGARVQGAVTMVERGGKFKERARLGVRFHTLLLADGTSIPIQTETVYREGEGRGGQSAAKISGGAIGGAILGAILGGGKGAIVGGATGAGAGATAVAVGDRSEATLSSGARVTVRLSSPVSVTVERPE
jgi:hypothetical protein